MINQLPTVWDELYSATFGKGSLAGGAGKKKVRPRAEATSPAQLVHAARSNAAAPSAVPRTGARGAERGEA